MVIQPPVEENCTLQALKTQEQSNEELVKISIAVMYAATKGQVTYVYTGRGIYIHICSQPTNNRNIQAVLSMCVV